MNKYFRYCLPLLAALALSGCEGMNVQGVDLGRLASAGQHLVNMGQKSEDEERVIGQNTAAQLLTQAPLLDDPALQTYVNRVGLWIARHSERPDLPWRFGVVNNSAVGAYAAPGGYVFITTGMLARMESEAELAGVLAHEVAHVVRQHHLQAIKKQAQTGLLSDLGMLALQASNARNGGGGFKDTAAAERFGNVVTDLYARGLDRGDEYEADAMGVVLAARAGYDPYGLASVLQGLSVDKQDDAALVTFLKVHPNLGDRLTRLTPVYTHLDASLAAQAGMPQTLAERYRQQFPARFP